MRILTFGFAALTLALILFSKKSWPPYLMMALFPIGLLVRIESKLRTTAFALFGVVAVLSTSYWATMLQQQTASEFHAGLLAAQPQCLILLALEVLLILSYAWLLRSSLIPLRQPRLPAELQ
jgi:hypothetical protein